MQLEWNFSHLDIKTELFTCLGSLAHVVTSAETDRQVISTFKTGVCSTKVQDESTLVSCSQGKADNRILLHWADAFRQRLQDSFKSDCIY